MERKRQKYYSAIEGENNKRLGYIESPITQPNYIKWLDMSHGQNH